jgi:hypothetical protein
MLIWVGVSKKICGCFYNTSSSAKTINALIADLEKSPIKVLQYSQSTVFVGGDRNPFPLESYQKACNQLEQTVQVIRKLMSSTASSNNYDDLILCPGETLKSILRSLQ